MEPNRPVPVRHDVNATAIHALNSQLLRKTFLEGGELAGMLFDPDAWIINVLYLRGSLVAAPALRTSSTLHRGNLIDHTSSQGRGVDSIDSTVPLDTSVSGRCVLSERPIWLRTTRREFGNDKFAEKYYRGFSLVDVGTAGSVPRAEIVFPLANQQMGAATAVGVLNMELFFGRDAAPIDDAMFELPRESINDLFSELFHLHSSFLQIGINLLDLEYFDRSSHVNRGQHSHPMSVVDDLTKAHAGCIDAFFRRRREELEEIKTSSHSLRRALFK